MEQLYYSKKYFQEKKNTLLLLHLLINIFRIDETRNNMT